MQPASPDNAYLKTKVMTASPAELRLLLFDGAIKFAEQAKAGLKQKNYEKAFTGLTRCQEIILELTTSLDADHAPDLCEKLTGLYTFMYTHLMRASQERDPALVDEVLGLLLYERETWSMVLERLVEENQAAKALTDTPEAEPAVPSSAPKPASDLIGGTVSVRG
ncbi:MAG: flagellar export chaperone FliS [Planctomycetota bacterium]|jgi:flagellar protein FliS